MKIIAFDTEFERRRTYIPILSITQIAFEDNSIKIFDCYNKTNENEIIDLKNILEDNSILKIIHSASQDMEAFFYYFNFTPKNIFDTQIAAKYLFKNSQEYKTSQNQIAYSMLLKNILNIEIDKQMQKSNWLKRPLSQEQLDYAKEDVKHLIKLYNYFKENLSEEDFKLAVEESNKLTNENLYKFNPYNFWNKNKYHKMRITPDQIEKLKKLTIWRENLAFKKNIPRQFIISNKYLVDIVCNNKEELNNNFYYLKYKKVIDNL